MVPERSPPGPIPPRRRHGPGGLRSGHLVSLVSLALAAGLAPLAAEAEPAAPGGVAVAAAGPAPAGAAEPPLPVLAPAWLDLSVNGVAKGTVLVQLAGPDAWVAAEDLERAGLRAEGGSRIERSGRSLVSLASLAPAISFTVDERALALRLVATQPLLGRTTLDLSRAVPPPGLIHREPASAYLNWALSGDSEDRRAATGELGIAVGPALLLAGVTVDDDQGPVRGLTTATWDDRERLVRWAAGDVLVAAGDALAGTGLVLGAAVGREFSLDPYLVQLPYPRTTVFSPTPATLEVWVDDTVVRRAQVAPGTIDLERLPVNVGLSEVRTVLRDPFGREVSASTFALLGSSTLAPGLVDWGFAAGARRLSFGTESFDYGGALGQAHVRGGLTPVLTLGGRVEGGDGLVSAGGSIVVATAVAELEATAAASLDGGEDGAAMVLAARRVRRRGAVLAQLRWDSGRYANGSLGPEVDRPLLRGVLTGSFTLTRRLTLLGELAAERWRDAGHGGRGLGRLTFTLPRGFFLSGSLSRTYREAAPDSTEVLLSLAVALPSRATAEVAGASGSRAAPEYAQASLTRAMPQGPGVGYRLLARGGDAPRAEGELRAQNQWARGEVLHQEADPWTSERVAYTSAQVSSGLVLLGGSLHPTRPVEGSYALVQLEGARGVRVLLQGQDMGRTDSDGDLLVTGLQPYLGNRIAIRDSDLPIDYRVDEVERVVAPRQRGGSIERFRVARQLAVSGRLLLEVDGKEVAPEWGEVAVELPGRRAASPVGREGVFWLEMIPPGTHDALILWEGRLCRFAFEVPRDGAGIVDLGVVRCRQLL